MLAMYLYWTIDIEYLLPILVVHPVYMQPYTDQLWLKLRPICLFACSTVC